MTSPLTAIRNSIIHFLYTKVAKPILFLQDPENVHDHMTKIGVVLGSNVFTRGLIRLAFEYSHDMLKQNLFGISFKNPIGLAAGFDKDAQLTNILPNVGFGYEEVGSITGEPCEGNPRPRLWRLPKSKSIVVYYGLKNEGSEILAKKLKNKKFCFPVGISIAKTNCVNTVDTKEGIKDYVKAYYAFKNIGHYTTINISCPNTFGGQPFTDKSKLDSLLKEIKKIKSTKPIFLKISPDLSRKDLDGIILLVKKYEIQGIVCSNLTKNRNNKKIIDKNIPEKGGLSGKVVEDLANATISYIYNKMNGDIVIIGCGGIFTAKDAYKKIKAGASLLQLITGMIFEGPQCISEINRGLVTLLKKDGYKNISEAVGTNS